MGTIVWKLDSYLQEHGIKPLTLEQEAKRLGYTFGKNSIYRLVRDDGPDNLSRKTLVVLIETLKSLTKRKVKLSDLIEYEESRDSNLSAAEIEAKAALEALRT